MDKKRKNLKKKKNIKKNVKKNVIDKKLIAMIVLIAISIYVCYAIFLLIKHPTDTFTIEEGEVYQEETDVGYIIRNEQVIKGENYANGMEKIKTEGEKTAKGESIFRYYSKNEDKLKSQISELDQKIQDVMASETGAYTSDMKIIEDQIDEKIEKIRDTIDVSKLEEDYKEINELVTKKAKIAGDLSPKGSFLNQLIAERSKYENELNSGAEYIVAPSSGIVSYRVDGLEEKLTPNNFVELNKEYLENLNLKTGKIIATNEEAGKIIDSFKCYVAVISNSEEAKNSKIGDSIKIRISNNMKIDAKIVHLAQQENGETLLVLEFKNQINELTNYRKVSIDLIWWEYTGLKVPNQAIINEDGLNYVVRNRAGYLDKNLIKVKKQNDDYSIITAYNTEELKNLGFTDKEINSYKKISMFDEVLVNPDLSKLDNIT